MPSTSEEIVHRLMTAIDRTGNGVDGDPIGVTINESHLFDGWDAEAAKDGARRVLEAAATAALAALQEGDTVGEGLVVARVGDLPAT